MSPSWLKAALVAVGVSTVPVYAFAEGASNAPVEQKAERAERAKGKDRAKHFPMGSERFMKRLDTRIAKIRERLDARMDHKGVTEAEQKAILAELDASATKVRAAATEAGKDGTVTAEEAKSVRVLAKDLRKQAHEKYGKEKTADKEKRAPKSRKAKAGG